MKIFAINPGSTSTKIALFQDETCLFSKNVSHDAAALAEYHGGGIPVLHDRRHHAEDHDTQQPRTDAPGERRRERQMEPQPPA